MVTVLPLFLLLTLLGAAFYWSVVLSFMALISPSTCTEINSHKHGRGAQAGDWQNFISSGAPGSCVEWRGQKKKKKRQRGQHTLLLLLLEGVGQRRASQSLGHTEWVAFCLCAKNKAPVWRGSILKLFPFI